MGITNLDLIPSAQKGDLVIFLGAGISIDPPTNLPISSVLTRSIANSICGNFFLSQEDESVFNKAIEKLRLEVFFHRSLMFSNVTCFLRLSFLKMLSPTITIIILLD